MGASFQLEFYSWEEIMIAKITLVSMLAAVALARPEADPQFYHHGYHHGVVGHVHPTCEQGIDTLQSVYSLFAGWVNMSYNSVMVSVMVELGVSFGPGQSHGCQHRNQSNLSNHDFFPRIEFELK